MMYDVIINKIEKYLNFKLTKLLKIIILVNFKNKISKTNSRL